MHCALSGVVFCLNFDPFCFFLLFPCQAFSLPFFIYLNLYNPENKKAASFEGMKGGTAEQNISGMWTRLKTWFWDLI